MLQTLTERLFDDSDRTDLDPFAVFEEWFALAREAEPNDPHAMALASVDEDGLPDVRMVLLNARDARGFCFFTNFESDKGRQLHAHPKAAVMFHWKSLRRQVRMLTRVAEVSAEIGEDAVVRPMHWSGFRLVPSSIEFWKDGEFRLHDRVRFTREGDGWTSQRLYP